MVRRNGELVETSWADALAFVADRLRGARGDLGALVAPLTSNEEGHLLGRLLRGIGSDHIDHRLRTLDFSDAPAAAPFAMPVAAIEKATAILLVGCNPRHEVPLLNHRIRKAARAGAKIYAINPLDFEFNFDLAGRIVAAPQAFLDAVIGMASGSGEAPTQGWIKALGDASASVVILGETALNHPAAARLRTAARTIATSTNSACNEIPGGANAIGLARAGVTPRSGGHDAAAMLAAPPKHLIVYHAGSQDTSAPAAFDRARTDAAFCVYIGAYACNGVRRTAHAVLPIGLPPEIDGSYTNLDGVVQVLAGAAKPPGDARPGWKVLRALGSALSLPGFGFTEIAEVRAQMGETAKVETGEDAPLHPLGRLPAAFADESLVGAPEGVMPSESEKGIAASAAPTRLMRITTTAIYSSDAVVRRSPALQAHPLARKACVTLHPQDALALGLGSGAKARVCGVELAVEVSMRVPRGGAWIEAGHAATKTLPPYGAALDIVKA